MWNTILDFLRNNTPVLYLTQSLWRDEAFSVLIAEPGGWETIKTTAADYNPPLYYLILHYWMKIFGKSEISIRLLSFLFFIGLLFIVYKFAKKIFKQEWPAFVVLLAALNPMLLYYGLEARMYSLYALTTTCSMYFFFTKKWKSYIIATILSLYTHPYTLFIPLTQGAYLLLTKQLSKKNLKILLTPFLFYLPWIFVIIQQFQNSKQMWIYPVDLNLITSVLGNLFIGYDGTPGYVWIYTKIITVFFILLFSYSFLKRKNRVNSLLFSLWVFLPLITVLGISIVKPIYVNRYVITVSVAQLFLLTSGIVSLPFKKLRLITASLTIILSLYFLVFLPKYIKKNDIRYSFFLINNLKRNNDLILAKSPLVFFESLYYSDNRPQVYLYNPEQIQLPGYLGNVLIPKDKQTAFLPLYPQKAFMINENGTFEQYSPVK